MAKSPGGDPGRCRFESYRTLHLNPIQAGWLRLATFQQPANSRGGRIGTRLRNIPTNLNLG
jgi:hypothetical protein